MFINTFNVFFPHAIIVLSCKFLMLQLSFRYNIRCYSLPSSPANSTIHSPLHYFPLVSDRWFGEGLGMRLVGSSVEAFFSSFSCPFNLFFLPLLP